MPYLGDYTPTVPGELRSLSIDFTAELAPSESIVSANAAVSVLFGSDPNAANLAFGSVGQTGNIISQFVGINGSNNPLPGVVYRLTMSVVTSAGQKLTNWGHLACNAIA